MSDSIHWLARDARALAGVLPRYYDVVAERGEGSWLVASDVRNGRRHLNVSEWDRPQKHADEAAEEVRERKMPPAGYLAVHPEARLSDAERAELVAGLEATFGARARRPAD